MLEYFQIHSWFFLITMGVVGLIIGSFLNVVIYRLPQMLQSKWRFQCMEMLGISNQHSEEKVPFNIALPRSFCPHCKQKIRAWENIPLLSYFILKGKCSHCQHRISLQYPLIEALSAILTIFLALYFGPTLKAFAAMIFTWSLICISVIDLQTQLLPDEVTMPLLWLGLFINIFHLFSSLPQAVLGAIVGYLSLWFLFHLFKFLTKKEGIGYGDFKLLAALGAWIGWEFLPFMIFFASILGLFGGLLQIWIKGEDRNMPIPFGPYLAIAGFVGLVWGHQLMQWYLGSGVF